MELRTKLTKTIDEIKTQNPNLKLEFVIFGHSLGGASASLVAYDLGLQNKIIINSVWTFGSQGLEIIILQNIIQKIKLAAFKI